MWFLSKRGVVLYSSLGLYFIRHETVGQWSWIGRNVRFYRAQCIGTSAACSMKEKKEELYVTCNCSNCPSMLTNFGGNYLDHHTVKHQLLFYGKRHNSHQKYSHYNKERSLYSLEIWSTEKKSHRKAVKIKIKTLL